MNFLKCKKFYRIESFFNDFGRTSLKIILNIWQVFLSDRKGFIEIYTLCIVRFSTALNGIVQFSTALYGFDTSPYATLRRTLSMRLQYIPYTYIHINVF